MAPDDPHNYEWLDRFLAGEGTADERAQWQRRIEAEPELRALVHGIQGSDKLGRAGALKGEAPPASRWDVDAAWKGALRRERAAARGRPWVRDQNWVRVAIAASILVVVSGAVAVLTRRAVSDQGPVREYATAAGERLNVTLSDGTQFALAPASRLRVPVAYGRAAREVTLDGEAFFRVVHDGARPFLVHAGNATATDVGTAFDVRSYSGDSSVAIAVAEGRVSVSEEHRARSGTAGSTALLGAGDSAAVSSGGVIVRSHEVDLEQ
jgi:ferric-dicitrate binding protein FerR (iron transport regulator)